MAFITYDADIRPQLAAMLRLNDPNDPQVALGSVWATLGARCVESAYGDILEEFIARGFTKSQVDQWYRGKEFNTDLALFWICVKGASFHTFDKENYQDLDRREELAATAALIDLDGNIMTPEGDDVGIVGQGPLRNPDMDNFQDSDGYFMPW